MSNWSLHDGARWEAFGVVSGNSRYTLLTSGAAHTKGNYTELIASTGFRYDGLRLQFAAGGGSQSQTMIDLALGPSGNETAVAENLFVDTFRAGPIFELNLPVSIPSGVRLAARSQSADGTADGLIGGIGYATGFASPRAVGHSRVIAMGADTSDTSGVSIDPGGTANTKGSWVELEDATTADVAYLSMVVGEQQNSTFPSATFWLFDIGIGPGGNEEVLIPNLWHFESALEVVGGHVHGPFPVSIPAGSRLSVRAQCDSTDATDRLRDAVLYGVAA